MTRAAPTFHCHSLLAERHRRISDFNFEQGGCVMLKQLTKRLRDRTVVTAAILSLMGCDAYAVENTAMGGPHAGDRSSASPIKHVIVSIGENGCLDHVVATYEPRDGEHV